MMPPVIKNLLSSSLLPFRGRGCPKSSSQIERAKARFDASGYILNPESQIPPPPLARKDMLLDLPHQKAEEFKILTDDLINHSSP